MALTLLLIAAGVMSISGAGASSVPAKPRARDAVAVSVPGVQRAALSPEERKFGIPAPRTAPPPENPGDLQAPYDLIQRGSTARASAAKVSVTLPADILLTYIRTCGRLQLNNGDGTTSFLQICCPPAAQIEPDNSRCSPDLVARTPRTSVDDRASDIYGLNWFRQDGPIWAASPPGAARPFGEFPSVRVRLLAFGSIPASATLRLSQPTDARGQTIPFTYNELTLTGQPPGTVVAGFPTPLRQGDLLIWDRTLTGPVNVRISDVRIDGVPIDVGSACRTVKPARLTYVGPRGVVDAGQSADDLEGRAGEFDPLTPTSPGAANGKISIPRFAGCRDGARSLDPLVTALASGPDNPLRLTLQSGAFDCFRDDNPAGGCPAFPGYDGPIADPVGKRRAEAVASSGPKAVRASAATGLRRVVASLPAAARSRYLKKLPAAVRVLATAPAHR